jgi:hypothetical protein
MRRFRRSHPPCRPSGTDVGVFANRLGRRRAVLSVVWFSIVLASCSSPVTRNGRLVAPNFGVRAIDQRSLSSSACGPAALLDAFAAGGESWRRVFEAVPGSTDRERLAYVIKRYALRPSRHFRSQRRWSRRGGIGAADLADMATEMAAAGGKLAAIRSESLVDTGSDPAALLRRAHRLMAASLKRGLPPILVLKRMERPESGGSAMWSMSGGHYVVVVSIPVRLARGADSFDIECIDPDGARRRRATIRISGDRSVPWLLVDCPGVSVGRSRSGRSSHLSAPAVVGRFRH